MQTFSLKFKNDSVQGPIGSVLSVDVDDVGQKVTVVFDLSQVADVIVA